MIVVTPINGSHITRKRESGAKYSMEIYVGMTFVASVSKSTVSTTEFTNRIVHAFFAAFVYALPNLSYHTL